MKQWRSPPVKAFMQAQSAVEVRISDLSFGYPAAAGVLETLAGINLNIRPGAFVSIVGANGCGKSTLLKLMAGLLLPRSGAVSLAGEPVAALRARKQIAWMAQAPALLPWLTVLQNVRLPLQVNPQRGAFTRDPLEMVHAVGLAESADAYPATLSGGMQQRVALARALVLGAGLWLLDEPFSALDEMTRETLASDLLALWSGSGATAVWVTHQVQEAVRMSDSVVVLGARPAHVQCEIEIALPRPRDEQSAGFIALVREVRAALASPQRRLA